MIIGMMLPEIICNQVYIMCDVLGLFEDRMINALQDIFFLAGVYFPRAVDESSAESLEPSYRSL